MKKKILSGALALSLVSSLAIPAVATSAELNKPSSIPVELYVNAANFSVTVPSVLPINVDSDGTVHTADNAKIRNNSAGLVEVKNIAINMANGWTLSTYNADFSAKNVDAKELGLLFNDTDAVDGKLHETFDAFEANSEQSLVYNAKLPPQSSSVTQEQIASVVFTIGWKSAPNPNMPEEIVYYGSLNDALGAVNNGDTSDTGLTQGDVAVGEINGQKVIVLMEDLELTETVNIDSDVKLNMNGHTITSTATPAIRSNATNMIVEATTPGSQVIVDAPAGQKGTVLSVMSGELTVNGGEYISNTSKAGTSTGQSYALYAGTGTTLNVNNATVTAIDDNNGSIVGVNGATDTTMYLTGVTIYVKSGKSLENIGVNAKGKAVITDCNIVAVADYVANSSGNAYASNSRGIYAYSDLELYNSYVWGAHSGVISLGNVYVDGGTYEGYGHGAFYLGGSDTTSYFYNADLNWAPMRDGAASDIVAGTNGAGFYLGNGGKNMKAYFDNCNFNTNDANGEAYKDMTAPMYGIVLRTSGNEANNLIYLSNCYVEMATKQMFRGNGTSGHIVYNGVGNDWSNAKMVINGGESGYISTEESYAAN